MSHLKKITDLKRTDSFIQVDTLKGYRYIDTAGEIINAFLNPENKNPNYSMTPQELILSEPIPGIRELKVSNTNVWASFGKIQTLESILHLFYPQFQNIVSIVGVTQIKRVGWRNYFFYEVENKEQQYKLLSRFNPYSSESTITRIDFLFDKEDVKTSLRIMPVILNADDTNLKHALLFDLDVFISQEEGIEKVESMLQRILEQIKVKTIDYVKIIIASQNG